MDYIVFYCIKLNLIQLMSVLQDNFKNLDTFYQSCFMG